MYIPHSTDINNVSLSSGLEPLVILYQANQSTNLQLYNGNFASISLFDTNEHLASNIKNIAFSLLRVATFIK